MSIVHTTTGTSYGSLAAAITGSGTGDYGLDHNLYVGNATDLVVQDSLFHDALGGHEIKSRAASSTITNNRIQDGLTATTAYSIDLPVGGVGTISGNLIEKGPNADNRTAIHFGGEGAPMPRMPWS